MQGQWHTCRDKIAVIKKKKTTLHASKSCFVDNRDVKVWLFVVPGLSLEEYLNLNTYHCPYQAQRGGRWPVCWPTILFQLKCYKRILTFLFTALVLFFVHACTLNSLDQWLITSALSVIEMFCSVQYSHCKPHIATGHWNCGCESMKSTLNLQTICDFQCLDLSFFF